MKQRMRDATLLQRTVEPDAYNQQIEKWEVAEQPIECFIYASGGQTAILEEVQTTSYQLVAITKDERPKEKDKLMMDNRIYTINSIIPTHRLNQLFLMEDNPID